MEQTGALNQIAREIWDANKNEEYRQDVSHWRGVGRWKNDAAWQGIGQRTLRQLDRLATITGAAPISDRTSLRVLEWGQGGGANLFAFRRLCSAYYGVDISQKNLAECDRMIKSEGFDIFYPILIDQDFTPVDSTVLQPVDVIISTAVFQHFPTKEYGVEVLRQMKRISRDGTLIMIQIRYDNGNEKYAPISDISQYSRRHITATSYRIEEFFDLCRAVGLRVEFIDDINSTINYVSFCMTG